MIFNAGHSPDGRHFEATVLAVDSVRSVCKILTSYRQSIDSVPWLSSIFEPIEFGSRVYVSTASGDPIIIGILPRVGSPDANAPNIDTDAGVDTGNYTSLSNGLVNDPGKPLDIVGGDKVISNSMGGLFGVLRGGSIVLKASRLAQIFISKYDDLVRIVARSFEIFTDLSVDVTASVRGRAYRYVAYGHTLDAGRTAQYRYMEVYGDTVLGNNLKDNYYGLTPGTFAAKPAADNIIRKYKIINGGSTYFYQDLYYNDGKYYTKVQNSAATAYTEVNQTNATYDIKTDDGTSFTRVQTQPGSVVVTFDNGTDVYTVTLNSSKAEVKYTDGTIVNTSTVTSAKVEGIFDNGTVKSKSTLDSNKAEMSHDTGSVVNKSVVDATTASLQYNVVAGVPTHFITADSTGVHMG